MDTTDLIKSAALYNEANYAGMAENAASQVLKAGQLCGHDCHPPVKDGIMASS